MTDSVRISPALHRPIRQDSPARLGEPTRPRVLLAVAEGRTDDALTWFDYLIAEHVAIHTLFGVWDWHMVSYYLDRAGPDAWPRLVQESIAPWIATTCGSQVPVAAEVRITGRNAILAAHELPWELCLEVEDQTYRLTLGTVDGQSKRWNERRQAMSDAITRGSVQDVDRLLDAELSELRLIHDILCDWAWALLSAIARAWGESTLGEVLRVTEEPWVTARYENLRDLGVHDLLQLTIEGMRGHFSGPDREGSITVAEESDRFLLTFDACGTGGRMRRGDPTAGHVSRLGAPYHFLNVSEAYDWTWGRRGVCAYCAHCAVVNQILPIEQLGFPMRMTLYPENPGDPCHWVIYKDRTNFPPEAFESVGKSKPRQLQNHLGGE